MDSASLAGRLDVTAMAVRQHLYALQQEKLVTAEERPVPLGRPAKFWRLTQERGSALSGRVRRAERRAHHIGAGCVRPAGDGTPARCPDGPAAGRLPRAHRRLSATGEENPAARENSRRGGLHGRGETRRHRVPVHRESLSHLRRCHGVPGFLRQRARAVPLGAGAGRQRRARRAHPFGRSPLRLQNRRGAGRIRRTEAV